MPPEPTHIPRPSSTGGPDICHLSSLACLPDTDGQPQHTLSVIVCCAILGSPRKRLTLREIYAAMEEKYAYYKTAGDAWKGTKRLRKRGRANSRKYRTAEEGLETSKPRRRRRPGDEHILVAAAAARTVTRSTPVKLDQPMGRSPPIEPLRASSCPMGPLVHVDDVEVEEVGQLNTSDQEIEGCHISPRICPDCPTQTDDIIERLQIELASLRRHSADTISLSIRLSDQLARTKAKMSETRSALQVMEMKLREATNERKQAENAAGEALRSRDTALKSVWVHAMSLTT
ncbi:hypothetical protein B0H14DRAFT_3576802 [Mycena olivaceomarginata]|nr:hypothetical protein B0H14DRAFT_3576802 [Mycena olivaceomarginata]